MKGITIRFADVTYETIREEAAREGITITNFVREAALARSIYNRTKRGDYDDLPDSIEAARRKLREDS